MRHRYLFSTAVVAAGLAVAAPAFADYPPDQTVTTVAPSTSVESEAVLPSTGSDSSAEALRIGALSVITGGGLWLAVRRRRSASAS